MFKQHFDFLFFLINQYSFSFPQFKETFQSTYKHAEVLQWFCLINKHIKFFSYFLVWVALDMAAVSQIQTLILSSWKIYVLQYLINMGTGFFWHL